METEIIQVANHEGILYEIPLEFIGKESHIGDKYISYQLLRLKRSGLFTIDELYAIASLIQSRQPDSLINWTETFMMLEKDSRPHVQRKLKNLQLA
ncbi:MAG: hypothetical protein JO301_09710 [Chitinophagaceae bacterium]|nr:hypothetical protein [Chitinophagaceae bacterium]